MNETNFICACATARHVARTLTQLYDRTLRDTGLEAPQFALLMTLEETGPCTQTALGHQHALDKTTVSRNVRWLERRGWIESSVGMDRRQRRVQLTREGRRRLALAKPSWRKAQDHLRAEMTEQEWRAMFRAFKTIAGAADRATRRRTEN
jgi:DNA-binding MarR family transcriptional regulator